METPSQTHDEPSKNDYTGKTTTRHPAMVLLTLELPEAVAMLRARRESLRGKADEQSALRVERLGVAIAHLVERIDALNAAAATAPSADSSAASAASTDVSKQHPVK